MKRYTLLWFLMCVILLTACTPSSAAEKTGDAFVSAVKAKDSAALAALFSKSTQDEVVSLQEDAAALIEYIQGDILSISTDPSVFTNTWSDSGKSHSDFDAAYRMKTTTTAYLIGIIRCTTDTFDTDNVGITALCIIEENEWPFDYVYGCRYDEQSPGITIDTGDNYESQHENNQFTVM